MKAVLSRWNVVVLIGAGVLIASVVALFFRSQFKSKKPSPVSPSQSRFRTLLGKQAEDNLAETGWQISSAAQVKVNNDSNFITQGRESLFVKAKESGGLSQTISVPQDRLYKVTAKVLVEKGDVRILAKDEQGNIAGEDVSKARKGWQTMEVYLLPWMPGRAKAEKSISEIKDAVLDVRRGNFSNLAQAQEKKKFFQIEILGGESENSFYVDDLEVDISASGTACNPDDPPEISSCQFYEMCDETSNSCIDDPNWMENLTDVEAVAIYQHLAGEVDLGLPTILRWLLPDPNALSGVMVGFSPAPSCSEFAPCGPVMNERYYTQVYEKTNIPSILKGFYPELSVSEISFLESRLLEIKQNKAPGEYFDLLMFTCDVEGWLGLTTGGGPCSTLFNKVGGYVGRLIPTRVKEGAAGLLGRGGEKLRLYTRRLFEFADESVDAAYFFYWIYQADMPVYLAPGKFAQLYGLEVEETLGRGVVQVIPFERFSELGDDFVEFARAYDAAMDFAGRYDLTKDDISIVLAVTKRDYIAMRGQKVGNIITSNPAFTTAHDQVTSKVVVNPQVFLFEPADIEEMLMHEVTDLVLIKKGGINIIGDITNKHNRMFFELVSSVKTGNGFAGLVDDFDKAITELFSNPNIERRFIKEFDWQPSVAYPRFEDYFKKEIIPNAFEAILRSNSRSWNDFAAKFVQANLESFEKWLYQSLKNPSHYHIIGSISPYLGTSPPKFSIKAKIIKMLQNLATNVYAALIPCGPGESCSGVLPSVNYNRVLRNTATALQDLVGEDEIELSSEWFATSLRMASLTERAKDGRLTRADVNEVIAEGLDVTLEGGIPIPQQYWEANSWSSGEPSERLEGTPTPIPARLTLSGTVYCGNQQRQVAGADVELLKGGWQAGNRVASAVTGADGKFRLEFEPQGDPYQYILTAKKGGSVHQSSYQCMKIDTNTFCTTAEQGTTLDGYATCDREGECTCTDEPQTFMCEANSFADDNPRALNFNRDNIMFILNQCPADIPVDGGACGLKNAPLIETRLSQRRANRAEPFTNNGLQLEEESIAEYKINLLNQVGSRTDIKVKFSLSGEFGEDYNELDFNEDGEIDTLDWSYALEHYGEEVEVKGEEMLMNAVPISRIMMVIKGEEQRVQAEGDKGWQLVISPKGCTSWQETETGFICGLYPGGKVAGMPAGSEKDLIFQIRFVREGRYTPQAVTDKSAYVNPSGCCGIESSSYCSGSPAKRTAANQWGKDFVCANSYCAYEPFAFYSDKLVTQVGRPPTPTQELEEPGVTVFPSEVISEPTPTVTVVPDVIRVTPSVTPVSQSTREPTVTRQPTETPFPTFTPIPTIAQPTSTTVPVGDCGGCVGETIRRYPRSDWDGKDGGVWNNQVDNCQEACKAYFGPECDGPRWCGNPGSTDPGSCCACTTASGDSCAQIAGVAAAAEDSFSLFDRLTTLFSQILTF